MQIAHFSLSFCPLIVASLRVSCRQLLWCLPIGDILVYTFIHWNSSIKKSCPFSSMYSIIYIIMWFWRRFLRVPWIARRLNQSILKETNPEYSLEGLMLKLKLQYFGHLMQRADSLEKTLMLGKIEGKRRKGQQRMR